MNSPYFCDQPQYLVPAPEAAWLAAMVGKHVGAIRNDVIVATISYSGGIVRCEPLPSNCGGSPDFLESEELMRLKFSAADEGADNWEREFEVSAEITEILVLHGLVVFGPPVTIEEPWQFGTQQWSYSVELYHPDAIREEFPKFEEYRQHRWLNQVDLGVRLRFENGRSVSMVAKKGFAFAVKIYEGREEEIFLRQVLEVPLGMRQ